MEGVRVEGKVVEKMEEEEVEWEIDAHGGDK